jgi:hypothetical protein
MSTGTNLGAAINTEVKSDKLNAQVETAHRNSSTYCIGPLIHMWFLLASSWTSRLPPQHSHFAGRIHTADRAFTPSRSGLCTSRRLSSAARNDLSIDWSTRRVTILSTTHHACHFLLSTDMHRRRWSRALKSANLAGSCTPLLTSRWYSSAI